MIKNAPDPKSFQWKEKDFEFAPKELPMSDGDEYIRQINHGTEYFAEYCGVSNRIETSIIVDAPEGMEKKSWITKLKD